jgi:L-seryl-tRNA(Ser) seleniumtransferase
MPVANAAATSLRGLPSVERLLNTPSTRDLIAECGRPLVLAAMRAVLADQRVLFASQVETHIPDDDALVALTAARVRALLKPSLRAVFNLSGTVLHTNLGRALLPASVVEAATTAMTRPVNLEFDLGSSERGERDAHVEDWLTRLTGAEAAIVVNNNAAAVYLVLNSLALRKQVLVSRGELVEIGGSFRIPDIMARAGCRLREVGTTNRTHARDFTDAVDARTAAVMRVHTSNYTITGFTAAVPENELAALAHRHDLLLISDLGSGALVDLEAYALPHEPTPAEALANGADIVTFSGDKLLGGPQCGLIVGRRNLIERIRKNPMKRALRVDKVRLAALEAVLQLYANPERLTQELPTLRLLTRSRDDILAQAQRVIPCVAAAVTPGWNAQIIECASQIGSGAMPLDTLPSAGIAITRRGKVKRGGVDALAKALRGLSVPVIGHIRDGALILDLRCLDREAEFVAQLGGFALPKSAE